MAWTMHDRWKQNGQLGTRRQQPGEGENIRLPCVTGRLQQ